MHGIVRRVSLWNRPGGLGWRRPRQVLRGRLLVLLVLAKGVLMLMLMLDWHGGVVVHHWRRVARVVVDRIRCIR